MKNKFFIVLVIGIVTLFTSCIKPFDKPEFVEVGPNETAFVIPMFTDSTVKTEDQVQLNENANYYAERMVSSKLIQIPHKWIQTGRFPRDGYYKGTVRVITVNLTPISGTWLANDKNVIKVETAASQGITIPMSYTVRILPDDAALYLSFYKALDFQEVIDTQINRYFAGRVGEYFHEVEYKDIAPQRDIILKKAVDETKIYFKKQGITIDQLAIVDGLIYEDAALQHNINEQAKVQAQIVLEKQKSDLIAKQRENEVYEANTKRLKMEAERATYLLDQDRLDREQQRKNTAIVAEAQAEAIRSGKFAFNNVTTLAITPELSATYLPGLSK